MKGFPAGALPTEPLIRDQLHFLLEAAHDGGRIPIEPIIARPKQDATVQ